MNRLVLFTLGWLALVPLSTRADDAAAVVEKAVRAMANSDLRLNRLSTMVRSEHGSFYLPGEEVPAKRTTHLSPPDRLKYEAVITRGGQPQTMILCLDGVNGWHKAGPMVRDMVRPEYEIIQDEAFICWLTSLLPLRQKGVPLKALPPMTINGRRAVGVAMPRPNRPDAQIYFDLDSGLPVKVKLTVREAGVEVGRECDLGGHRDFDGIKLPTRITVLQNGKKIEDWTVDSYQTPDRLDNKVFAKPR